MDEESRKQAIVELCGLGPDNGWMVLRATERFTVLCFAGATAAPEIFGCMEDAGWHFVANVSAGCPMFRKSR